MRSFLCVVLLMAASVAGAATLHVDGDHAIGISNLTISGADYDVVFDKDGLHANAAGYVSWYALFEDGQSALITNAVDEMAFLFNSAGVIGLKDIKGFDLTGPYENHGLVIFSNIENQGEPCFEPGSSPGGVAITSGTSGEWGSIYDQCVPHDQGLWADPYFKVSAVPLPAAVWLFASALMGLGWLRRKPTA